MSVGDLTRAGRLQARLGVLARKLVEPATLASAHDVPDFVFVYDPRDELIFRDCLPGFVHTLAEVGRRAELISLAAVLWEVLDADGWTARIAEAEPESGVVAANDTVGRLLTTGAGSLEERVLARIRDLDPEHDLAVLYRAGALFPVYRTSALMARMEGLAVPVVLCFPGRCEPPHGLSFMGMTEPDSHYRADILSDDGRSGA